MNFAGILAAILAALFMGTIGVFSRKTGLNAEVITFFRLFFGAGFLVIFLLIPQGHTFRLSRQAAQPSFITHRLRLLLTWPTWPVIINGVMLAGFIIFYIQAMNLTTMANAIMVLYLAPLIAAVFAHFFLGERLNAPSVILICAALFGFAMMMEFRIDFSSGTNHILGLGFAGLSLACYSSFILINRTISSTVHVYTRTFYQLVTGALCMVPMLVGDFPRITTINWLWLIGAGFFPGFLGILLAVVALEKLPAATFGTLAYFEPIFVVFLGWILFTEHLNTLQLAGCLLILTSGAVKGYLTTRDDRGKRPANQTETVPPIPEA